MRTERISILAVMHAYSEIPVDHGRVMSDLFFEQTKIVTHVVLPGSLDEKGKGISCMYIHLYYIKH